MLTTIFNLRCFTFAVLPVLFVLNGDFGPVQFRDYTLDQNTALNTFVSSKAAHANPLDPFIPNGFFPPATVYRSKAYSVEFTSPPCLLPRTLAGESSLIDKLSSMNDIVLIGIKQGQPRDEDLALDLVDKIIKMKKRQVIIATPDAYDETSLRALMNGDTSTSNDNPNIIARMKKQYPRNGILPVGLDPEVEPLVIKKGFESLDSASRDRYVPYPDDFVSLVGKDGFKKYTESVIDDEYANKALTATADTVTNNPEKYFALRILQDEGIASQLAKFTLSDNQNKDKVVILVTDESRIKFGYGIQERTKRILNRIYDEDAGVQSEDSDDNNKWEVSSILLNPTAQSSLSYTNQLRLTLGYGKFLNEQRPLANYLWFSDAPPLKLITRPKNAISKEGERPPGESSVIGAFNARSKD